MRITEDKIAAIVADVSERVGVVPGTELFYADHNHEELSEGAWSISLEGNLWDHMAYDWDWSDISAKHGVLIECLYHWCLAVYPNT